MGLILLDNSACTGHRAGVMKGVSSSACWHCNICSTSCCCIVNTPLLPVAAALLCIADHKNPPPLPDLAFCGTYHAHPVPLHPAVDCPWGSLYAPALGHVLMASHSPQHSKVAPMGDNHTDWSSRVYKWVSVATTLCISFDMRSMMHMAAAQIAVHHTCNMQYCTLCNVT